MYIVYSWTLAWKLIWCQYNKGTYYRDVLLKQEMLPDRYPCNFWRLLHFSAGHTVHRSRYCSERFRLSLLTIYDLPTALLATKCRVRCRTVFIGRRCKTLTIWSSVWLTCGTVWSKASSRTRSTSDVHDFMPVSMQKRNIMNSLCNLHFNFVINWCFVCHYWTTEAEYIVLIRKCLCLWQLISRDSVATCLRCGGQCNNRFVANFLMNSTVKECRKSVNICQS